MLMRLNLNLVLICLVKTQCHCKTIVKRKASQPPLGAQKKTLDCHFLHQSQSSSR